MGQKVKKFISKEFLSDVRGDEFGAIASTVSFNKDKSGINSSVRIADCSRTVTLDFDVWYDDDEEVLDERVAKAETLAAHTAEFAKQLKKAAAEVKKNRLKKKETDTKLG